MRFLLFAIPLALTACDDLSSSGCDVTRDFLEEEPAGSARIVRIEAEAGSLEVIGRPDLSDVRVPGVGCADDDDALDEIELVVQRTGDAIHVVGITPPGAQLDLLIEVPEDMILDIEDTSGEIVIENMVEDVEINDGSGDLRVTNVGGDVSIVDGSGAIEVEDVDGTAQVEDGSGDIFIRNVGGDVLIVDGSGDIDVDTVGGDLIVLADSSGRIRFRNVSGRVELPD